MATTFENFYSYLVIYSIFSVKKIFFQELLALNEKEAINMFSLAFGIVSILSIYLALEKDKENRK